MVANAIYREPKRSLYIPVNSLLTYLLHTRSSNVRFSKPNALCDILDTISCPFCIDKLIIIDRPFYPP